MFVRIIVPVLNEESYIGVLLESLASQTFEDFEVVVSDGGSTDKTRQIVESFADRIPVTFAISDKKGVAYQRNFGARDAVTADFLMFIDADCYLKPNFLQKINVYTTAHPKIDMFTTWALILSKSRRNRWLAYWYNLTIVELPKYFYPTVAIGGFIFTKRSVFEQLGGYNVDMSVMEDLELFQRARASGFCIRTLRSPAIYTSDRRAEREGLIKYFYKSMRMWRSYIKRRNLSWEDYNALTEVDYPMHGGTYYNRKTKSEDK